MRELLARRLNERLQQPGGEEEDGGAEEEGVGIFWERAVVLVVKGGEQERGKQGGSRETNEPKPDRMLLQASRATCVGGREGGKEGGRDKSVTHTFLLHC